MKNRNEDSGIKYRTLGDSAPYGKSKVFFACHPNDHKLYFDKIVKMLFEYENCVIYYEEPRQEPCPEEENTVSWEELIIYLCQKKRFSTAVA